MSSKDRRKREKEELRAKILQEALHIIGEKGVEQLTIRALANRIEYSPRTIYLYFANKQDLLHSLVESGYQRSWDRMSTPREEATARENLTLQIAGHLRMGMDNPEGYRVVLMLLDEPGFIPGEFQRRVEEMARRDLGSYLSLSDDSALDRIFDLFLASLRGMTLSLIRQIPLLTKEELEKRMALAMQMIFGSLNTLQN